MLFLLLSLTSSQAPPVQWKVESTPVNMTVRQVDGYVAKAVQAWQAQAPVQCGLITVKTVDFRTIPGYDPRWASVAKDGKELLLNSRMRWYVRDGPQFGWVDIRRVLMHEFGHFFRLEHGPTWCIMATEVIRQPRTPTLQPWDVQAVKAAWGVSMIQAPLPKFSLYLCRDNRLLFRIRR